MSPTRKRASLILLIYVGLISGVIIARFLFPDIDWFLPAWVLGLPWSMAVMLMMGMLIHTASEGTIFFLAAACSIPNLGLLIRWIAKLYVEETSEV